MLEIVIGLLMISLGFWGVFDEYYYVADFVKGGVPLFMMMIGLLAAMAGIVPIKKEEENDG
ncbi:MAG: hypothetical protein V3V90_08860 [Thermodesulfobacteriota bacterium]|jgi:hypothetical protein